MSQRIIFSIHLVSFSELEQLCRSIRAMILSNFRVNYLSCSAEPSLSSLFKLIIYDVIAKPFIITRISLSHNFHQRKTKRTVENSICMRFEFTTISMSNSNDWNEKIVGTGSNNGGNLCLHDFTTPVGIKLYRVSSVFNFPYISS